MLLPTHFWQKKNSYCQFPCCVKAGIWWVYLRVLALPTRGVLLREFCSATILMTYSVPGFRPVCRQHRSKGFACVIFLVNVCSCMFVNPMLSTYHWWGRSSGLRGVWGWALLGAPQLPHTWHNTQWPQGYAKAPRWRRCWSGSGRWSGYWWAG